MPGLGTSFGRGGATTAPQDLANADAILIMGSSMAENHPVGFQWVIEAREKRRARHSCGSAVQPHVGDGRRSGLPLRAGSDILFLGGLINYVLEHEQEFREYVVHYTNASAILRDDFQDTEDLGGLFSGLGSEERKYDPRRGCTKARPQTGSRRRTARSRGGHGRTAAETGADVDELRTAIDTLQHPRCVFQVLKRHFARYTPEMVEQICGVPKERFLRDGRASTVPHPGRRRPARSATRSAGRSIRPACRSFARRPSCSCCSATSGGPAAASWRCAATRRSKARPTSRRSTTSCPAICRCRCSGRIRPRWPRTSNGIGDRTGWWSNFDKYIVSLLKAYYGDAATRENDCGFRMAAASDRRPLTLRATGWT